MNAQDKRVAIAAYKERKPAFGVYAVICSAAGEAWVGTSRHVDTQQNGLWFTLRQGGCRHAALQAVWREHGAAEFRFEELERLRADYPEIGRIDELKRRQTLWRERLRAQAL